MVLMQNYDAALDHERDSIALMKRRFATLDVFTRTAFAGNPLAVVLQPEGLDTGAMLAIAREFNLSETVFVCPPVDPTARANVRIFTPARELPFAGHPTIGTAVLLGSLDGGGERAFVLEEKVGRVPCRVRSTGATRGRASFDLPRLPAKEADAPAVKDMARALGLKIDDFTFDNLAAARWSAGNAFTFVPVRGLDAIGRCAVDLAAFEQVFGSGGPGAAFVFCRETRDATHAFHARMFAPAFGVLEDPATGSAVAAFSGYLAASGQYADGTHVVCIEQGYEMGRPSLLELTIQMRGGTLAGASIAGDAVVVTEGTVDA
ncbi:MAG TPA: PhzF family phenazine biosynthesis protein [Vicinamibacterales bacterium]|nr:PhzF family phenazine biosynthesis protein [Vicinamibacterales bacterium]